MVSKVICNSRVVLKNKGWTKKESLSPNPLCSSNNSFFLSSSTSTIFVTKESVIGLQEKGWAGEFKTTPIGIEIDYPQTTGFI